MRLNLQDDDAKVLRIVVAQYLSDLRMEIGGTEDYDMRRELHQREDALRRILTQIDGQAAAPGAGVVEEYTHHHHFAQRPGD
jgi:hypothetical protein